MKFTFIKEWIAPWRAYLAEFLGTFVFVFVSSGAVLTNLLYADIGPIGIALATGLSIAAAIYATYHLSGGHLNPAVTLALGLAGKIRGDIAIFYVIFQIAASFAAAGMLLLVFGLGAIDLELGTPLLGADITVSSAVILEAVLTAVLVFVIFATMIDRRGPVSFGPLSVGIVVVFANLVAGPISGASLNPARVVGPAMVSQSFDLLVVPVVGPLAGALFALVYEFVFLRKK